MVGNPGAATAVIHGAARELRLVTTVPVPWLQYSSSWSSVIEGSSGAPTPGTLKTIAGPHAPSVNASAPASLLRGSNATRPQPASNTTHAPTARRFTAEVSPKMGSDPIVASLVHLSGA